MGEIEFGKNGALYTISTNENLEEEGFFMRAVAIGLRIEEFKQRIKDNEKDMESIKMNNQLLESTIKDFERDFKKCEHFLMKNHKEDLFLRVKAEIKKRNDEVQEKMKSQRMMGM